MKTIDVKGKSCPLPLIETKKALQEIEKDEALKVITNNENSKNNIIRFLNDNGMDAQISQTGDVYELIISEHGADLETVKAEEYCSVDEPAKTDYVVVFGKDRLGDGSDDLGYGLAGSFLHTLNETEKLPSKIMFLNSGINLVTEGSPILIPLNELAKKGVEILSCGTCLDYFDKTDKLAVGRISNMLEILESMQNAGKVINI